MLNLKDVTTGLLPVAFENKYNAIENAIDIGDIASACEDLDGMIGLANAQSGKKITIEQAAAVITASENLKDILDCSAY